jgi:indolepyruvate ferredoxin oxidoreductase beta subunit
VIPAPTQARVPAEGLHRTAAQQPFAILIAALGGEGGGVLVDWLVRCALRSGLAVQATSVPGVAQRTGATSYYLEMLREPLPAGSRAPVFSLNPLPGRVDVLVASEAVESARMIERGFVAPGRTVLIASTHRVYTTAEKMHMADGRYDIKRTRDAARQLARQAILFDMEAAAARHGTILSAVMFGALAGAGVLPWSRELCEEVIGESDRGVQASLAGFDEAAREASRAVADSVAGRSIEADPAEGFAKAADADALRILQISALPDPLLQDWSQQLVALPQPMQASAAHGALRCRDYQDDRYASEYLRDLTLLGGAAGPVAAGSVAAAALDEAARHLALWMCFEDVIRVADLKSRPDRQQRLRAEAQAQAGDIVRVVEYLKPGIEEVAAVMPRRFGAWLMRRSADGSWLKRAQFGLQIRSSSLWGHLILRGLARLRPARRASLRFYEEQEAIAAWVEALRHLLPTSPRFALQLAGLPQVLKGYGDTQLRGRHNYARLWAAHVAPALGAVTDLDEAALRLQDALAATLADPEEKLNKAAAAVQAAAPTPQTIRWIERPGRNA